MTSPDRTPEGAEARADREILKILQDDWQRTNKHLLELDKALRIQRKKLGVLSDAEAIAYLKKWMANEPVSRENVLRFLQADCHFSVDHADDLVQTAIMRGDLFESKPSFYRRVGT